MTKMLKLQRFLFLLIITLSMIWTSAADHIDLIEMSCDIDEDCYGYRKVNIKPKCVNNLCRCVDTDTDERTSCRPDVLTRTNIIGGYCPCTMPNSKCQLMHDLCYCQVDYVASEDRRRCLPEFVKVGDDCEMDKQCQLNDVFSVCDMQTSKCRCKTGFSLIKGRCTPVYRNIHNCTAPRHCDHETSHAECAEVPNKCICNQHYVTGNTSDVCLPGRTYNQSCEHDHQCQIIMGRGSKCVNTACDCMDNYVLAGGKLYPDKEVSAITWICEPKAYVGKYCRINEDCHNNLLDNDVQLLSCKRTECGCQFGRNRNAKPCPPSKATTITTIHTLWFIRINVIVTAISLLF